MDDIILVCRKPYPAYDRLDLLLARISRAGRCELLSPGWERVLGYSGAELNASSLFDLIHLPATSARRLMQMIWDESEPCPIAFGLTCKGGGHIALQWYRRFDRYDERLYLLGEPVQRGTAYPVLCRPHGARRGGCA